MEGGETGTRGGAGAAAGQLKKIKKSVEKSLVFFQGKEEQEQGQKRTLLKRGDD